MTSNRISRQSIVGVAVGVAAVLLGATALLLSGCGGTAAEDGNKSGEVPAPGSVFVPTVEAVTVRGEDFVEHIELSAVTVRGMESTPLYAKVGGFVKEIRRVGRATVDGKLLQITDTLDRQTYRVRDVEFRAVGSPPKNGSDTTVRAAAPDELKMKWPKLHDAWQSANMLEIDIGSNVEAGTLLSVLDVPEMADDTKKQDAAVERATQTVAQKDAAIRAANAHVGQAQADHTKAMKDRDVLAAKLVRDQKELARIERLGNNVDKALLEEVQAKVAAATAELASGEQQIKSAEETVKVAKAAVDKAEADKNVAEAQVKEANAELARLKTLEDYVSIRAPFTGTIVRRMVDHGSFVQPAQGNSGAKPLFAITQTDKVRVVIPVPGRKSYKIRKGQEVVFHTIGGLPGATVKGTITRSADTLDAASRMMRVETYLTNPAANSRMIRDGRGWKPRAKRKGEKEQDESVFVRPGMFGVVTVRNDWKQLRMVPAAAVAGTGDERYVMQIINGNSCVKRFVTIVFNDAEIAGISDGIPVGAMIVANGVAGLKDGQKVALKSE